LLSDRQLRDHVATMLEWLGHELLTPDTAANVAAVKNGKNIAAFTADTDLAPTALTGTT